LRRIRVGIGRNPKIVPVRPNGDLWKIAIPVVAVAKTVKSRIDFITPVSGFFDLKTQTKFFQGFDVHNLITLVTNTAIPADKCQSIQLAGETLCETPRPDVNEVERRYRTKIAETQ